MGSRWRISYGLGSLTLEITDYRPPYRVEFKRSPILGNVPNFTIELQAVAGGTLVEYKLHPEIPTPLQPLVTVLAPP